MLESGVLAAVLVLVGCYDDHGRYPWRTRDDAGVLSDPCEGPRGEACCSDECLWMERHERCVSRERFCEYSGGFAYRAPCPREACSDVRRYPGSAEYFCDGTRLSEVLVSSGVCE